MHQYQNLLLVVQSKEQVHDLVNKAIALANFKQDGHTQIHAVRVIYEGIADLSTQYIEDSIELKNFILASEKSSLQDVLADATPAGVEIHTSVLWNRRVAEGVAHAAEAMSADLIIKASDDGKEFMRTPDDWNILRESKIPVLLIHPGGWSHTPKILAAIDALDDKHQQLNQQILTQAAALSLRLSGELQVCTFYPLFEPWSTRIGMLQPYKSLRQAIEHDVALAVNRLTRTIGAPSYKLQCIEGVPEVGIKRLAEHIDADILVIGNHARDGLAAAFIGNTAEKILHTTNKDILTVI